MKCKRYFFIQFIIIYLSYNFSKAIIGPIVRRAQPNEFPSVVSIMKALNYTDIQSCHKCTGTLVSKQDVITAEHCLTETFTEGFKVMAGSYDLEEAREFFPVFVLTYEHWLIYRRRSVDGPADDLAFIKLSKNIPDSIQFAPLGNIDSRHLVGSPLAVAGFGRLNNNLLPRFLQTAEVKALKHRECEKKIREHAGRQHILDHSVFCTIGEPYAVLNRGDSGGPLFQYGILVAVNIAVSPNVNDTIQPYQVNIHLNIRNYHEFFEDVRTTFYVNHA